MRNNNSNLQTVTYYNTAYYEQTAATTTTAPMMRTLRLEPNNLQISIPAKEASKKQMVSLEQQQETEKSSFEDDLDFFQTSPLGSSGFELDCWEKKTTTSSNNNVTTTTTEQETGTIGSRGNFSFGFEDPNDFDWTENDSWYSVEEQDSSSISDSGSDDEDDEEYEAENDDNEKFPTSTPRGKSRCCHVPNIGISKSVEILQPLFQTAVDQMSSTTSTGHVHFGATVVTEEYTYEKPSADDFFRLYYSAHELQRLQDQYKIDIIVSSSSTTKTSNDRSPDQETTTTGVLEEQQQVDDSIEVNQEVDYCPDYPVW